MTNFYPPFQADNRAFPALTAGRFKQTSPHDFRYNCIAYAAGDVKRYWWPIPALFTKWPDNVPRELTVAAFVACFATLGYQPCADEKFEAGYEKIAIYALAGEVKHASRQLLDGSWASKLGAEADICHEFGALDGPCYGTVSQIMKRLIR